MLLDHFEQDDEGKEQSRALAEFISLIHAPYFLQARLASATPRLEQDLYVRLCEYQGLFQEILFSSPWLSEAALGSLMRHTWYLTDA